MLTYTIKDIYENIDKIQPGDTLMVHRNGNLLLPICLVNTKRDTWNI